MLMRLGNLLDEFSEVGGTCENAHRTELPSNERMSVGQCVQAAGQRSRHFLWGCCAPFAEADHAIRYRKQILNPVGHFARQDTLLLKRLFEVLFRAQHSNGYNHKRGKLRHGTDMLSVKVAVLIGHNPQCSGRLFAVDMEGNQQNIRQDNVARGNPVVAALGICGQNGCVQIEDDTAGA